MLLVIHGWNVSQSVCDVGVGLAGLPDGGGELPATCTVSPAFLRHTLPALQAAAARDGVAFTLGARYPPLHANNLLQACARRAAGDEHPAVRTLATLVGREQLDAVQLESASDHLGRRHRLLRALGSFHADDDARMPRSPGP